MKTLFLNHKRFVLVLVTILLTYGMSDIGYAQVCSVGDILSPGESCIDPGTGDTFSVLADGRGRYLFITAGTGITLQGTINGISRNFVATKRGDGTWLIESVTPGGTTPPPPVQQPDLVIESVQVEPATVTPGQEFQLHATLRNQGTGTSAATTVRYYRSTDNIISANDTQLGTGRRSPLAPNASIRRFLNVTAPTTPGTYYYGVCVDSVTNESNTANNCSAAVSITVQQPAQKPDLEVEQPTVSKSTLTPGENFTLFTIVKNEGAGSAAATTLRYYRSTDAIISTSDTEVGTDSISGLGANESNAASITLTAPTSPGMYYYGACVKVVTDESHSDNNCSAAVNINVAKMLADTAMCKVGDILQPGEGCILPSGTHTFFVDESGNGYLGEITDDKKIDIGTLIVNDKSYTFIANEQDNNSWKIEELEVSDALQPNLPLIMVPGEMREVSRSFPANFSFTSDLAVQAKLAFSTSVGSIDTGLFGLLDARLKVVGQTSSPQWNPTRTTTTVEGVTFTWDLKVAPSVRPGTTLLASIRYGVGSRSKPFGDPFGNAVFSEREIYTVFLTVKVRAPSDPSQEVLDVTGDGSITILDIIEVAQNFGKTVAEAANPRADVNQDGKVNLIDLVAVAESVEGEMASPALSSHGSYLLPFSTQLLFTTQDVQQWIDDAKHQDLSAHGIVMLEHLLAVLTLSKVLPKETALLPNYPNPFNPETWISYHLANDGDVLLSIYDINGALVRELDLGHQRAGYYTDRSRAAYWDGRNAISEPVASGVYFYQLSAGDYSTIRRMVILK